MHSDAPAPSSPASSAIYTDQPRAADSPAAAAAAAATATAASAAAGATPATAGAPPPAAAQPAAGGDEAAGSGRDGGALPRGAVPLSDTLSSIAPDVTLNAVIEALSASGSLADALRVAGDARAAGVGVTPRALGALVDAAVGGAGLPALHAVLSAAAAARDAVEYGGWDASSSVPAVGVPVLTPPPTSSEAKKKRRAAAAAAAKKKRAEAAASSKAAKAERERVRKRRSGRGGKAPAEEEEEADEDASAAAKAVGAAGAGAAAVARVAGRAAAGVGAAAAKSATASAAETAAAEADAAEAAVAAAAAPPPGAVILPDLPDRARASELVAGTLFLATTLTALTAEVLEPLLAHHGSTEATGFLLLMGFAAAADRYLRGGAAGAAVLGGLQRLLAEDPVRETRVEAACFLAAYTLGLPWVCYRPNAVEAVRFFPVLVAGEEAMAGIGGPAPIVPAGAEPPPTLSLLDRYLVWLMAGAAAEVAIDGRLIEANIGRGRDVLRRLSGVPGADNDPPVPPAEAGARSSAVAAARRAREDVRLRWAVAEATVLLQRHAATYDGLVNKMLDGASAGECAAFVETALRADREVAAAAALEGGEVIPTW